MIRFDCDWCRRTKSAGEIWILGLAAEAIGVTAARREVTILPTWNRDTAVHPLAVHFCCEECKDDYMARVFDEKPVLTSDVVIKTKVSRKTIRAKRKSSFSRTKQRSHRPTRAA